MCLRFFKTVLKRLDRTVYTVLNVELVLTLLTGSYVNVKVKRTLVQALRLYTDRTAHGGSRGIALTFHDHGTRRE